MITRRRFLYSSSAALAATSLWTWRIEPHWVEFVERDLSIDRLPATWRRARLVQISDVHVGPNVDDDYLVESFRRVRDLAPELVVYTGDLTSHEAGIHEHLDRLLPEFPRGARGTIVSLGNHDYGPGWRHPEVADRFRGQLEAAGMTVLVNQMMAVDGLQVVGMGDLWGGRFDPVAALSRRDPELATLVLSHNPDTVDKLGWDGYTGTILAGHTHGGQCKPPFLEPPLLPVHNRRYTAGEFELSGGRRLYINRGLGHLTRVRFNVRPEVTVFELRAE